MRLIERLMTEHRRIEAVLDALNGWAGAVERRECDGVGVEDFLRFVGDYTDAHHHGKEEDMLFVALCESGMPRHSGPIAVMMHEHDMGRALMATLREASVVPKPWGDEVRESAIDAADGFAELLRLHIQKEDQLLYVMAMEQIDAAGHKKLDAAMDAFEQTHAARRVSLEALGEALVARWAGGVVP